MSKLTTSEAKLTVWALGLERGRRILNFCRRHVTLDSSSSILDIGAGKGGISIAIAEQVGRVVSVDLDEQRLNLLRRRVAERGLTNVHVLHASALNLPLPDASFDLVILNGVLEYMGLADDRAAPKTSQQRALAEAYRLLKPGGILYLAIENRWYWPALLADPHVKTPLVAWLPRSLADVVSKLFAGEQYRVHLHSWRVLRRMFQHAGFDSVQLNIPVFTYQFPLAIEPVENTLAIINAAKHPDRCGASTEFLRDAMGKSVIKRFYLICMARLRLLRWSAPHFVIVGEKKIHGQDSTELVEVSE